VGVVIIDAVRKRFSRTGRWVLDGVELELAPGTVTVVAAGNGIGKSTLLRIVAGASAPTAGGVHGRPAVVAYIPERAPVRLRMTARQYLTHVGRLRGLPPATTRTRIDELTRRLRLCPGADVQISALSKGNGQKVAVLQAFLRPPELLVVDEPYTGLDAHAGSELRAMIGEAAAAGCAVLASAHQPRADADRVFVLSDGRLSPAAARPRRMMRITLTPVDQRAAAGELAAYAIDQRADADRVTLRTTDADRLVGYALANGWSLVDARPEDGDQRPGELPS
jgi:ABC-type multidrug transport system ATPase subunit